MTLTQETLRTIEVEGYDLKSANFSFGGPLVEVHALFQTAVQGEYFRRVSRRFPGWRTLHHLRPNWHSVQLSLQATEGACTHIAELTARESVEDLLNLDWELP